LRLGEAARYAAENGYDALATTLTISPYQDPDAIRDEGQAAAAHVGIEWVDRDFRSVYLEATRRSRELGMYRQNYCGCELSDVEAQEQRATRRAERAATKAAKAAAALHSR
jgi:predicted adenine nucleotide alpha hydrolase (AANH) superfamily ATPase